MIPAAYRANVNSNFHFFFFYHEKKKDKLLYVKNS